MEQKKYGYVRVSSKDQNEERQIQAMIEAGATRLGTSSGVKLMECDCEDCHCKEE